MSKLSKEQATKVRDLAASQAWYCVAVFLVALICLVLVVGT